MKENTKAKWIVGIAGVALSAFVIGQLDESEQTQTNTLAVEINDNMSNREKELVKLDWSEFSIQATNEGNAQNDRTSRRSKG